MEHRIQSDKTWSLYVEDWHKKVAFWLNTHVNFFGLKVHGLKPRNQIQRISKKILLIGDK